MKKYLFSMVFILALQVLKSQTTYILLRHAEKDTTATGSTTMQANPPLSQQGQDRAEKLKMVLKDYTINQIYTTHFIRTINTVAPLAKKYNLGIQKYDHKKLSDFANQLLQIENKTIVIVGHNTTTPALVNLLIKQNKFVALDEREYNKIFIVTIVNNNSSVNVIEY